jgi:deoxypyrimidine-specific 5' nucleotidase type C protein (NT5C)
MQLYLDCDGVLADFDRGATELLGMPPRAFEKQRGIGAFWQELARHPDFYGTLPLMPDAMRLFEAVRQLNPVILTGLPRGKWAAPQKVRWAAEHFPGTRILTVMAINKRNHAQQGDILVDDQLKHAHLWAEAGGIFVHHIDAENTVARLAELGVPVRDPGAIAEAETTATGGTRS